jgi:hypothetical protein
MARIPGVDFSSSGRYGWEPSVATDVTFSSVPQALAARSISVSGVPPSFARRFRCRRRTERVVPVFGRSPQSSVDRLFRSKTVVQSTSSGGLRNVNTFASSRWPLAHHVVPKVPHPLGPFSLYGIVP